MASALFGSGHDRYPKARPVTNAFTTEALIAELVRSTGVADPYAAIRIMACDAIARYSAIFDVPTGPIDVDALASFLGIARSDGRVSIRVNPDRPETRIRFSTAHEVSHTFFPNYQAKTWCRTDARFRSRNNPDDLLEMLCDVGASELILPAPWFIEDATTVSTAAGLVELAKKYVASREATLRRFAESHERSLAAAFFSWKLKPAQKQTIGNLKQTSLFGVDPAELALQSKRLRLDYSIPSPRFLKAGLYLPPDKSIENDGPLYMAASTGQPCDGECWLDLGRSAGAYQVLAIPVWTDDEDLGPNGENGVGAIIEPIDMNPSGNKALHEGHRLFD
jgi:Zn-dependent peptidase ImmA (M78 family)